MPGVLSTLMNVHERSCGEVGHTWDPTCYSAASDVFLDVLRVCPGIYPPLYLASAILRGKGLAQVPRILADSLRSSVFLALNGFGFVTFFCFVAKLSGGFHLLSAFLPGLCGSFCAILAERKSRRGVLALYVAQLAVEFIFHQLEFRGYVTAIPRGEVLVFSVTTAVLMYLYRHREAAREGFVGSVLKFLLWENQSQSDSQPIDASRPRSQYQFALEQIKLTYRRYTAAICASLPRHPVSIPLFNSLQVGVRGFLLSYGLQTALGLVSNVLSILRDRSKLFTVLFNKNAAKFGCFVGGFVCLYKTLLVLLQALRGEDDAINTTIAGGLSGLSMLLFPSSSLAMNLASKVAEMIYLELYRAGKAPSFYYFDCILYAISFGFLSHGATLEPHNLKRSYYKFLLYITAGKWGRMNHFSLDVLGTNASHLKQIGQMPVIS